MSHPILVAGAAGGAQGSTGRHIAGQLIERGLPVRALVDKADAFGGIRETASGSAKPEHNDSSLRRSK